MAIKSKQKIPVRFKKSYGIACCRYNLKTNLPEILMIKKRYTYAFFDFVFAKYKKKDDNRLRKLFNQMSIQEKAEILRLDFDKLWARIRIKIPSQPNINNKHNFSLYKNINYSNTKIIDSKLENSNENINPGYIRNFESKLSDDWFTYKNKKDKFKNNFLHIDKGKRLKRLINGTKSIDSIWEIPKGRPNRNEKPINTALREFKEETDISIDKYTILIHIKPIVNSYIINRCSYKHTYYIAIAKGFNWNPEINFCSYEQMTEVENLQWVSLEKAKHLNLKQVSSHIRILGIIKKIINIFKENYKLSDIVSKAALKIIN